MAKFLKVFVLLTVFSYDFCSNDVYSNDICYYNICSNDFYENIKFNEWFGNKIIK
jgi:hypothetical protein